MIRPLRKKDTHCEKKIRFQSFLPDPTFESEGLTTALLSSLQEVVGTLCQALGTAADAKAARPMVVYSSTEALLPPKPCGQAVVYNCVRPKPSTAAAVSLVEAARAIVRVLDDGALPEHSGFEIVREGEGPTETIDVAGSTEPSRYLCRCRLCSASAGCVGLQDAPPKLLLLVRARPPPP